MSYGVRIYSKETIEDFIKDYPEVEKILKKEGDWFEENLVVGFDSNLDNQPFSIIVERLIEEISEEAQDEFYELSPETFEYNG